ncbi:MAG: PHP domain-containing protein [Candidatus Goldiibacteriota bacterium]
MNNIEKWADLHIHTLKSDGTYSVREVFEKAKYYGISALSITDHDTVAASEEAVLLAEEFNIIYVPGIELSALHEGKEVHIVALNVDYTDREFKKKLAYFQKKRTERAKKIINRLKDLNVDVSFEELFEYTENANNAGRLHIAKLLVNKRFARNIKDAFEKYLGEGRPAYAPKAKLTVSDAVKMTAGVGGVSILAHPAVLDEDEMIGEWKKQGLDGLEAFHPDHSCEKAMRYIEIADKHGLLISGGSDCHGTSKDHTRIGRIKLPYEYFEKIQAVSKKKESACG